MHWSSLTEELCKGTSRTKLFADSKQITFVHIFDMWRSNDSFCHWYTELLTQSGFEAFFWETPAVTKMTATQNYEHVLVSAPSLTQLGPDSSSFFEKFQESPSSSVVTFSNLSRDAVLVVPKPVDHSTDYAHLAKFLRNASQAQSRELWRALGFAAQERISSAPLWISTAGMGVPWLHLRLDSRPKYYRHSPYKMG